MVGGSAQSVPASITPFAATQRGEPGYAGTDNMPFRSKAQRRKFAELLVKGEISPDTFEEWNRETGRKLLPERVAKKKRVAKKTRVTKRTRAAKKRTRKGAKRRS